MLNRLAIDPYNCVLNVTTSRKKAVAFKRKKAGKSKAAKFSKALDGALGIAHTFCDSGNCVHFIMYLPKEYREDVVWHEALHMAWYILDAHSVRISVNNHEALTYLQEAIVREVKYVVYKFTA